MLQVEHARRECDMSELNREISLESLYGGRIAPAEVVLEGMRPLEQALNAEFHEQQDRTLQVQGRLANELRSEPSGTVDAQRLPETIRLARDRYSSIQDRELPSPVWAPETQRIFTGSIGATVVPPYDYQWTWSATTAGATIQALSADSSKGAVLFTKASFDADPASVSARGAVGIFFRPVVTNGILRISSNPSFSYMWDTFCWHSSTHSDGFVGLYVGSYTLAGGFDGARIDQKSYLWSDDSWWYGTSGQGTNSGFPVSAQLNVDSNHYYAIWVWCGGRDTSGGDGFLWFSTANSNFSMQVPSITWELF
jgi:hypothetical protein